MITYVDTAPTIELRNGGFILTFKSGDTETQMLLTLHAMTALCGVGMHRVKEAQLSQPFEPIPFKPKRGRR
jgi:hypothetical protein